jgi:hypothetical protein
MKLPDVPEKEAEKPKVKESSKKEGIAKSLFKGLLRNPVLN